MRRTARAGRRPLPHRAAARRRRHGRGVPRPRPAARAVRRPRTRAGAEDPRRGLRRLPRRRRPAPRRVRPDQPAASSPCGARPRLRPRPGQRPRLLHPGTAARPGPRPAARRASRGLAPAELGEIAMALAGAVAHAHRRGVLHGDLKPGNAILAEDGLRLIDFGLGQPLPGALPGLPRLDRERFAAWTPCYAAPELLDGAPLSAAADVYALACLLYELAAGRHPFARLDARQAREQELQRSLTRPPGLPPHCWPALRTALAFDPAKRRIDAAGLLAAFRAPVPGRLRLRLTHG
ncbi:protein kinase [Azotobacter chroococcum]